MDGTGYGTDGSIWGGEILEADVLGFRRIGSVTPFLQIGGDLSAKEGWRIAAALIQNLTDSKEEAMEIIAKLELCDAPSAKVLLTMAERKLNAVTSTSAGRLFDAVSAMLGIRKASTFEGEASTALQFAAEWYEETRGLTEYDSDHGVDRGIRAWTPDDPDDERYMLLDTHALIRDILIKRLNGEDPNRLAWQFHDGLAAQITESCLLARERSGRNTVALSGGVFQNTLLLRLTVKRLRDLGFQVLLHSLVPPNDGGIALGQALAALAVLNLNKRKR